MKSLLFILTMVISLCGYSQRKITIRVPSGGSGVDTSKIPLIGTEPLKPVTGTIELKGENINFLNFVNNTGDNLGSVYSTDGDVKYISYGTTYRNEMISTIGSRLTIQTLGSSPKGLEGDIDYSPNYDSLSYIQKSYADNLFSSINLSDYVTHSELDATLHDSTFVGGSSSIIPYWDVDTLKFNLVTSYTDALYSALSHTHTFSSITSKPTTISGYGITDFNSLGDARWQPIGSYITSETDPVWLTDKPNYITSSSAASLYSPISHTHTLDNLTSKTTSSDIEITDYTKGIILKTLDGTRARITLVKDADNILTLQITSL